MGRNIDDLVDDRTQDIPSPSEKFHNQFLEDRPRTEWAPYIDETARDISADVRISDTMLTQSNFGRELGTFYRRGLYRGGGEYTDLPDILGEAVSDEQLGLLAYLLNELSYEIVHGQASLENTQDAMEAVVEKVLTREMGEETTTRLPGDGGTVADIAIELFENETIATNIDLLLSEVEDNAGKGLLALMDEPQMMTSLWDHQREALIAWYENDYRGYVDMATATGKTVLGLAAIALQHGELHPADQVWVHDDARSTATGKTDVLVVAHSDLILEQWRREFDHHLNIPKERTTGSNDITLEWGRIHFRTPQSLVNEDYVQYDLVLLDEAHHYATGSEWGQLLEEFEDDVLALSGSVDDAGADSQKIEDRLTNTIGPQLKRYSISEARDDGVIPSFDWEVRYAPASGSSEELEKTSWRAEAAVERFRERLARGDIDVDTDRRLRTYQDLRTFSHTSAGSSLKQSDDSFRDLVTRLFSRRTTRWNLSPSLEAITDLVLEHSANEKVVVLADSNAQVDEIEQRLSSRVAEDLSIYRVSGRQDQSEQRETIDEFDTPGEAAVLLGTGDLLGEGVDMPNASVAINMATGSVNPELVQRIGRVLRNPDEDGSKHAMFYNVVSVPPSAEAAVLREDGKRLIENAAAFCGLGARFDMLPGFATSGDLDLGTFQELLESGASFIAELDRDDAYDWTVNGTESEHLRALHAAVQEQDSPEPILGTWEEYAWEHSGGREPESVSSAPGEDLTHISGVTTAIETALVEAGYKTIADLAAASQADLAGVEQIDGALAARINADVGDGGSEDSADSADGTSTDEDDTDDQRTGTESAPQPDTATGVTDLQGPSKSVLSTAFESQWEESRSHVDIESEAGLVLQYWHALFDEGRGSMFNVLCDTPEQRQRATALVEQFPELELREDHPGTTDEAVLLFRPVTSAADHRFSEDAARVEAILEAVYGISPAEITAIEPVDSAGGDDSLVGGIVQTVKGLLSR